MKERAPKERHGNEISGKENGSKKMRGGGKEGQGRCFKNKKTEGQKENDVHKDQGNKRRQEERSENRRKKTNITKREWSEKMKRGKEQTEK